MNTRYYMVIIKGEIKTSEIMSCGYNRNTPKWDVKFNTGKIRYVYNIMCILLMVISIIAISILVYFGCNFLILSEEGRILELVADYGKYFLHFK